MVEEATVTDVTILIERVQLVGRKLAAAQPRELAVGNVVRRILGVIRDEAEENRDGDNAEHGDITTESRPEFLGNNDPLLAQKSGVDSNSEEPRDAFKSQPAVLTLQPSDTNINDLPAGTLMFSLLSRPNSKSVSLMDTPGTESLGRFSTARTPKLSTLNAAKDVIAEVKDGIDEIIDELNQADDQIASYASEHIHSNEIILTHTSSITVQKFLLKAAAKRKFTVIHAESFPNDHDSVHHVATRGATSRAGNESGLERFQKSLTAAGVTVILVPDSAIFALMSRVNKVILGTHAILANGGLIAAAGARAIAVAAKTYRTPVVVLSGVYKLSPIYPFDLDSLIEYGDASKILEFRQGDMIAKIGVENPLYDFVSADLVDLYITNL